MGFELLKASYCFFEVSITKNKEIGEPEHLPTETISLINLYPHTIRIKGRKCVYPAQWQILAYEKHHVTNDNLRQ